jgi:uncharacterized membrane protein YfcA
MPHLSIWMIVFLITTGFLASFIDSTVGGGGLISVPALLFTGLPPALALGTNKLAGSLSAMTSTLSYLRSKKVDFKLVRILFPLSFLGAILGADLVHHLPTPFLKPLVIVLLIGVTLYTLFKKDLGRHSTYHGIHGRIILGAGSASLLIGFYDGFFGPGTGSFLIISFLFIGFDFIQSSGNAKALNFASNIAALLTFAWLGTVDYRYGLIMGAAMIAGAIVGSRVAIRKGVRYVRPLFIAVTVVMIGKQLLSLHS